MQRGTLPCAAASPGNKDTRSFNNRIWSAFLILKMCTNSSLKKAQLLFDKKRKDKESQSSRPFPGKLCCVAVAFSNVFLTVPSALFPVLCCKNQECPRFNEAPLWKDRMGENWINVNMAIRLPPSRRNMANLSHSCRTAVNHFVTLQTFICILLAKSRGRRQTRS